MELLLAIATILGGIAAGWYFWDKWRDRAASRNERSPQAESAMRSRVVLRAEARAFGILMGEDSAAARAALDRAHVALVGAIADAGGQVVAAPAESVVALFDDAGRCVEGAIAAHAALSRFNQEQTASDRVHYRFGIDAGEVALRSGVLVGSAAERAAELSVRAPTDGIRLSAAARALLPENSGIAIAADADGVFSVASGDPPAPSGPPQLESLDLPPPGRPSVVLLPFACVGADAEGQALAEGLRIDIQNALVKMSGLFLVAAGSANAHRGVPVNMAAARLGVRHALEGTVQRISEQVRVSMTLMDATTGVVIWSERYDRTLDASFELQDEIAQRVATALDVKLAGGEQARVWHKCLTHPGARDHFYRGLQAFFKMDAESMASAKACFERVAALVPDSPIGSTNVAMCLWFQVTRGWTDDPDEARRQAGEWAERAVAMEDADGQAHTVLGNVRLLERRFDEALAIARQAVAVRPGCTNANGFLANVLLHCGENSDAVTHARRAIRISPVYPPWFMEILSGAYRECGQSEFAVTTAQEGIRLAPKSGNGRVLLASALVRGGWPDEARRVARQLPEIDAGFSVARYAARQPFRNPAVILRIAEELKTAGLPD
jgi:adenylate cyclase